MQNNVNYALAVMIGLTGSILGGMIVYHGIQIENGNWLAGGIFGMILSYVGAGMFVNGFPDI